MSDSPQEPKENPGFFTRALELLAYPLSIITGLYYGRAHAHSIVYDIAKETREMDAHAKHSKPPETQPKPEMPPTPETSVAPATPHSEIKPEAVHSEIKLRNQHELNIDQLFRHGGPDTPEMLGKENRQYEKQVGEFLEGKGFKNFSHYWEALGNRQKMDTVMSAITAAGITLGVILSITNSKELLTRFTRRNTPPDQTV